MTLCWAEISAKQKRVQCSLLSVTDELIKYTLDII
jgi:hypothetical protein